MANKIGPGRYWLYGFSSVTISAYFLAAIITFITEKGWEGPIDLTKIFPYLIMASIASITYNISFPYLLQIFSSNDIIVKRFNRLFSRIIEEEQRNRNLPEEKFLKVRNEFLNECKSSLKTFVNMSWYRKWDWKETERELLDRENIKLSNVLFLIFAYIGVAMILMLNISAIDFNLLVLISISISLFFLLIPLYYSFQHYHFILFKNCPIIRDAINRLNISLEEI